MNTPAAPLPSPPRANREPAWLLLVYQLPVSPSNARVKTWRRLQKVGALAVRNSVYVLPNSAQAREDLEWIKAEIVSMKGQATLFAADGVDSLSGEEIVAAFRAARQQEFEAIRREASRLPAASRRTRTVQPARRRRLERAARLLRERWSETAVIDFFGAPGRDEAAAAVEEVEQQLVGTLSSAAGGSQAGDVLKPEGFRDRVWATRPRPGIDRLASAWLIRRFIDPRAEFRFAKELDLAADAVPFDMFGAEFSHQGDNCTFETLAERFGIASPAVEWLGRIVHDLDLKDERYGVPEAAAIGRLVDGLRQVYQDDTALLEHGVTMFEALYRSFPSSLAQGKGRTKAVPRHRTRR